MIFHWKVGDRASATPSDMLPAPMAHSRRNTRGKFRKSASATTYGCSSTIFHRDRCSTPREASFVEPFNRARWGANGLIDYSDSDPAPSCRRLVMGLDAIARLIRPDNHGVRCRCTDAELRFFRKSRQPVPAPLEIQDGDQSVAQHVDDVTLRLRSGSPGRKRCDCWATDIFLYVCLRPVMLIASCADTRCRRTNIASR
ncbi:MAG: hypothetical protein QOI87_1420 [Bradyrhizobium sp.]|nr:hypothetical protein [Bradyrhizobium sp.]